MKFFKDMDDNQFWMTLWSFAVVIVLYIATVIGFSSFTHSNHIAELVLEGHDIMELSCLYNQSQGTEAPCVLLAQEKAKLYVTK